MTRPIDLKEVLIQVAPCLRENAAWLDATDGFIADNFELLKSHGVFSALVPEEMGGPGFDTLTYALVGTPAEGSASILGTTLSFDPGSDFQDLNAGETREVAITVTLNVFDFAIARLASFKTQINYGWPSTAPGAAGRELLVRERRDRSIIYDFIFRREETEESDTSYAEVARGSVTVVCVARRAGEKTMRSTAMPDEIASRIQAAPPELLSPEEQEQV